MAGVKRGVRGGLLVLVAVSAASCGQASGGGGTQVNLDDLREKATSRVEGALRKDIKAGQEGNPLALKPGLSS